MNILFIHEVEWLNKVVFDVHTLAESLSLLGHRIYAIDYENPWQRSGFLGLGSLKTREIDSVSRAFSGSSVTLIRPGFIRIPGLSRLSAGLTHCREIRRTIKERNIDAIVLYGVATNGWPTIYLGRKLGVPVVFRSIDVANQLVPYGCLRPIVRMLEKKIYARADMILSLTPGLTRYVTGMGASEKNIRLLPMPVDTTMFHPTTPDPEIGQKWGIKEDDQVILFIGTLFDFSGLDLLIPLFPRIRKEAPKAKLLIVGDGPQRQRLDAIIKDMKLQEDVIITGFQPYQTMPRYINLAAVCLNSFLTTGATRDIFPGKIVQYLACGKAVVATSLAGLVALIEGEEKGIAYAATTDEIADKLTMLLNKPEHRRKLEQNGLDYVKRAHSHESIARQLEAFLKEAIDNKKAYSRKS